MPVTKRKISVSLDADLVAELEGGVEGLSAQVNEAVRRVLEERRRNRQLRSFLEALDADEGPVEEALIERFTRLLE